MTYNRSLACLSVFVMTAASSMAFAGNPSPNCSLDVGVINKVQNQLKIVVNLSDHNGSLFGASNTMWSAVVDRAGVLCSIIKIGDAWPGSRAIAIAKAETANDFSNDRLALSTTNLYAPTQPGGSLYGLNNSNTFNAADLPQQNGLGGVPGGIITFGGGVALYLNGKVIGGLGVSGDSSCADHAVAFRMRQLAGYNGIPGGVAADGTDNIIYADSGTTPTGFEQPHCFPSDLTPAQVEQIPSH